MMPSRPYPLIRSPPWQLSRRDGMAPATLLDLRVGDLMSRDPMRSSPDEEVSKVLGTMRKHDVHEMPVVRGEAFLGMVSYATVLHRRNLPMTTRIESLLVRPPAIREEDVLPPVAEILMSSGYRALPVLEGERLVGLVSRSDLVRAIAEAPDFADVPISRVMTPDPHVVQEAETIRKAREVMRELDERALPVVDASGRVTGVVGLKDLVEVFARPRERATRGDVGGERTPVDVEIKGVMSAPPVTATVDASAAEAARLMDEYGISSVVVVDADRPIGIVTQVDLLEHLASLQTREEAFVQISGLDNDDWWTYETLYAAIGRGLRRIANIVLPRILNVHVVTHKSAGDTSKYSIRARLTTESGLYVARDYDWDPWTAMQKVMEQFERRIKKEKEQTLDRRKRSRRPS